MTEFNGEIRENLLFSVKSHGLKWPNKLRCRTSAVVEPLSTIPPTYMRPVEQGIAQ
jgi:hypothetical protein